MPTTRDNQRTESPGLRRLAGAARPLVAVAMILLPVSVRAACVGDCSGDCDVTVDEIVTMVNVALGSGSLATCRGADANGDGEVTIDEIIAGVSNALNGCECGGCGNGQVDPGEECDDGGLCIGGHNAGAACITAAQCEGDGICQGGAHFGRPCASDDECPDGICVHCQPFGGDGCAANCTNEVDVPCAFVPGRAQGLNLAAGTSGAVARGDAISTVLPISGNELLTVGKPGADGVIPIVVKAAAAHFERTTVGSLGCACFRAVAFKTCGGTIFERDGSPSPSCTEGFAAKADCSADRPCAFVHGPGNSANGVVACGDAGLAGIDLSFTQDAGACDNPPACTMLSPRPVMTSVSGQGPKGSVLLLSTTATGSVTGTCPATFCSDADPLSVRGTPSALVFTTGSASAAIHNANRQDGSDLGPFTLQGAPFDCTKLQRTPPDVSGFATVGAFPFLSQPTLGDVVSTSQVFCQ